MAEVVSIQARPCGGCMACCKVMGVVELEKAPGQACLHISPPQGCGIHGSHPASCKRFVCRWVADVDMADEMRPDRCQMVLTKVGDDSHPRLVAHCDVDDPMAWRREPNYSFLRRQAIDGWGKQTVAAMVGEHVWIITPAEDMDLGVVHPRASVDIEQFTDGRAVVTVRPPEDAAPS